MDDFVKYPKIFHLGTKKTKGFISPGTTAWKSCGGGWCGRHYCKGTTT